MVYGRIRTIVSLEAKAKRYGCFINPLLHLQLITEAWKWRYGYTSGVVQFYRHHHQQMMNSAAVTATAIAATLLLRQIGTVDCGQLKDNSRNSSMFKQVACISFRRYPGPRP